MTRARNLSRLGNLNAITATDGNLIGIGSTTPGPGTKLTVVGDANFTGVITAAGGLDAIGIQSGGANITTGTITALNFVGTGNTFALNGTTVDISIAAGGASTDNINTGTAATFGAAVGIADSIFHIGDDNTQIRFPANDTFTVETAGAERVRVSAGGSVGIGTNAPGSILDLQGNDPTITLTDTSGTNDVATIESLSGALRFTARDGNADGEVIFRKFDGTTQDETLRITNTGNIGIGTNDPAGSFAVTASNTAKLASGIVTARQVFADEFIGTGDKLIFSPTITTFNPSDGATDIALNSNITLTFDQQIYAGVGSISIRQASATGTEVESIGIGTTLISGQTLTFTPFNAGLGTAFLPSNTDLFVVLPQGLVTNAIGGGINSVTTYNFTTVDFSLSSIVPANSATNVGLDTNITLNFTSAPTKGTGNIQLYEGSTSGTLVETFNVASSGQISISGNSFIINPTNDLGFGTSYHTIIPNGAIQIGFAGLNTTGTATHSFTTRALALGDAFEGGFLICQNGGTRWIVSPRASEVSRDWYNRADSNTRAQAESGCTGWFVPDISQLQNPGWVCRQFWDSYSNTQHRSNTQHDGASACNIEFGPSSDGVPRAPGTKSNSRCVRSFRTVNY